jgi:DNA polymerase-3 subunit epsilon
MLQRCAVGRLGAAEVAAGHAAPPEAVGVYAFRDAAGGLLYVGTSRNLARRVRSYFGAHHPRASKPARIARLASSVGWRCCGSVLEALVLEARTIGRERPHFNRRLKQTGAYAFVRFDPSDPFPRLEVTRRLDEGPWRYCGPFPGGRVLTAGIDRLADALGLRTCPGTLRPAPDGRACLRLDLGQCSAPCLARATPGAYGRLLARALGVLGPGDAGTARAAGARALPPPAALPGPLVATLAALRAARRASSVIVVLPAAGAPGHRLLGVADGRLRAVAPAATTSALRPAFLRVTRVLEPPASPLIARAALDEVRIVTAWLASREGRAAAVDVGRLGPAAAWARVEALATMGPLFAPSAAALDQPQRERLERRPVG